MTTETNRMKTFDDLKNLNVSQWVEKKGKAGELQLSYISWVKMVDLLLTHDPDATWEYREWDQKPFFYIGDGDTRTAMVVCTVNAFGRKRTVQLPVLDHRNRPIPNPDAFDLNTAMMRCLAKAIALHGIGIYIFQGEDLPPGVVSIADEFAERMLRAKNPADLEKVADEVKKFAEENPEVRDRLLDAYKSSRDRLANAEVEREAGKGAGGLKAKLSRRSGREAGGAPAPGGDNQGG